MNALNVDLVEDDPRWSSLDLESICARACEALSQELGLSGPFEICLLATNDAKISQLNASFRDNDKPTNVLSWPTSERGAEVSGEPPKPPAENELGDIAISFDTCTEEARQTGTNVHDHVTHLVIHGILHLFGYDHERDEDATLMESIEISALERLTIANPY